MLKQSWLLEFVMADVIRHVLDNRNEFVTPEHFMLYGALNFDFVKEEFNNAGIPVNKLCKYLTKYIDSMEQIPTDVEYNIDASLNLDNMLKQADQLAKSIKEKKIGLFETIIGLLYIESECPAKDFILNYLNISVEELGQRLLNSKSDLENSDALKDIHNIIQQTGFFDNIDFSDSENFNSDIFSSDSDSDNSHDSDSDIFDDSDSDTNTIFATERWEKYVTRIDDEYINHNSLIGRTQELERTIHILQKRERHNVLYIGESGVGKTAMIYGLIRAVTEKTIYAPDTVLFANFYQIDMSTILAGTQYRGDFEKRIKTIMDGLSQLQNVIVCIDDIHTMIGMGVNSENTSNDASSMLLKYLDKENIRFIGTTTFQDYSRHIQKNKAFARRFQTIEINEPDTEEATQIIQGLLPIYEKYHNVEYRDKEKLARYAVEMSSKYISNRHLPEKAIDLIDEAGAYRRIHPLTSKNGHKSKQWVDCKLISEMLVKVCKLTNIPDHDSDDENTILLNLANKIKTQIYGQDQAVNQIVEAIQMSKAGLLDSQKPIAAFLFVGQTGVGKTEIVKVLAKEMNMELIRFDMSEYTEKHTVAKLIGSPAGYIGYDDGGLLTDAIRKNPNSVLLLDEIEKAHSDIYNILLQIMDYANLADNKGQKADFRHVILVMTSNAGAQYAHQATVGFNGSTLGSAMMTAVKKTFKPEFINRLTATVLFNDINEQMAMQILNKKINELRKRIANKNITLEITTEAIDELLRRGFSPQYGAREIDRVLNSTLNPLLMKQILFGKLKNGGTATLNYKDKEFLLN